MNVLIALFLGLVQGITEFLPVSSSGHLAVLQNFMNVQEADLLFELLLHMGTLISILVVYRVEVKDMLRDGLEYVRLKSDSNSDEPVTLKPPGRALLLVIVGTLPMFIGIFFVSAIERLFFNTFFIGFAFLVTGGLLFVSSKLIAQGNKTEKTMTIVDALLIGMAQTVALLPGLSRSGTTIAVGLSRGLSGQFAVRFSLLLAIPAILGGFVVTLFRAIAGGADFANLHVYLAGFVVSAVVGYFAIHLIRKLMAKGRFGNIAYYCWAIGFITLIWSLIAM
jgi:undecaprenyl-diphosphatase